MQAARSIFPCRALARSCWPRSAERAAFHHSPFHRREKEEEVAPRGAADPWTRSAFIWLGCDVCCRTERRAQFHPALAEHVLAVAVRSPAPEVISPRILDQLPIAGRQ